MALGPGVHNSPTASAHARDANRRRACDACLCPSGECRQALLRTHQPRSGRMPSDPVPTGAPEHAVSFMPANATQRAAADGSSGENAPPALLGLCSARGPLRGVTTGTAEAVKTRRYLTNSPYTPRHWYWRAGKVRSGIIKHGLHRPTGRGALAKTPPPRRHWYGRRGWYSGGSAQAADRFACAVCGLARAIKRCV